MSLVFVLVSLLVNQIIKAELSNEALVAIDQQYRDYSRIYDRSNELSMYLSGIVQNMTKNLFHASDILMKNASTNSRNLIVLSQKTHSKGVAETKCVEALNIQEAIKKLDKDVEISRTCFLLEANKGPKLEDEVTTAMIDLREYMVNQRKKCSRGEDIQCLLNSRTDLYRQGVILIKNINEIIEKAKILEDKLDRRIFKCELLSARSLKLIKTIKDKVENC